MSDDSDHDDAPRRGHAGGASSTISPSDAHAMVYQFIKDVQPRHIRSRQKEHITSFAKWYFAKKPVLVEDDIAYLLLGDQATEKKGLLESCGNSNLKRIGDIKNSSVLALELVVLLMDATVNVHAERFLDFLPRIPLRVVHSMKLDRHILSETSTPENAFKLLFLLAEQNPRYTVEEFISPDKSIDALEAYNEWLAEHMEDQDALDAGGAHANGGFGPRTWAEVTLEDLDREEMMMLSGGVGGGTDLVGGVDLESVLDATATQADGADEVESMDPLGLTKIRLNGRGQLVSRDSTAGASAHAKKSKMSASSKKMKLFWKKLLMKNKEKQKKQGAAGGIARPATIMRDDDDDDEGGSSDDDDRKSALSAGGGLHLADALTGLGLGEGMGSVDTSMPDFDPVLFLSSVHGNTSLAQLERGVEHLEQAVNSRTSQMKKLVEQHFGQYCFCKDTIDHLYQLLQGEISSKPGGASTGRSAKLLTELEAVRAEATALYVPLLQRKQEADQIQQVLSILARFKFLFSLPGKLDDARRKQNWEAIIRDYQKAKQLVVIKQGTGATAATAAETNAGSAPASATKGLKSAKSSTVSPPPSSTAGAAPTSSTAGSPATTTTASNSTTGAVGGTSPTTGNPSGATGSTGALSPTNAAAATIASSSIALAQSVTLQSLCAPGSLSSTAAAVASGALGIPESVLFEIGRMVHSIRRELFKLLDNPLSPLEEQQKRIAYLIALDCEEEDPSLYYLRKQRDWIAGMLEKAMEEHCLRVEVGLAQQGSAALKAFVPSLASQGVNAGAMASSPLRLLSGNIPFHLLCLQSPDSVASMGKMVRKLCAILRKNMPDFVELARRVENGEFGTFRPSATAVVVSPTTTGDKEGGVTQTSATGSTASGSGADGRKPRGSISEGSSKSSALLHTPGASPAASPMHGALTSSGSIGAMSSSPLPAAAGASSSLSPSPVSPAVPSSGTEALSVGQLVASLNAQFANYIRLALFPPTAAQLARSPAALAAAASASPTSQQQQGDDASSSLSNSNSASGSSAGSSHTNLTTSGALSPELFPPGMHLHVHEVLSAVEGVRSLRGMASSHVLELRLLADQLTALYLDYHVRELLTASSALWREEAWEIDGTVGAEADVVALFGSAGAAALGVGSNDAEPLFSFAFSSESTSSGGGSGGNGAGGVSGGLGGGSGSSLSGVGGSASGVGSHLGPLGSGHMGSTASNAPFQVTTLPASFAALVQGALRAFAALPVIKDKWVVERIVGAVFESMKGFADGMHALVTHIRAQQETASLTADGRPGVGGAAGGNLLSSSLALGGGLPGSLSLPGASLSGLPPSASSALGGAGSQSAVASWTKPSEPDRRLLLVWSNLLHLHESVLHPLLDALLALLPVSTHRVLDELFERQVVHLFADVLEPRLALEAYKKSKVLQLNRVLRKGMFQSGFQWRAKPAAAVAAATAALTGGAPTPAPLRLQLSLRSCPLELLLQLALVHDEVLAVRRSFVDDVMESLVESLALSLERAAQSLEPAADVQGAAQLLLELEFLQQRLDYYLTTDAQASFDAARELLQGRMEAEAAEIGGRDAREALLAAAEQAQSVALKQLSASTAVMFSSFTTTQVKRKRGGGGGAAK